MKPKLKEIPVPSPLTDKVTMTMAAFTAPYERRNEREAELQKARGTLKKYLRSKFDHEDWHGVQDAASDLRDIDSELDGLRY